MTSQSHQSINITVNQAIVAFVVSMAIACGFVAYITNTIVNGKVSALATQLSAQNNPASATAASQTNNAPGFSCVDTEAPVSATGEQAVAPLGGGSGISVAGLKYAKYALPASVTYNQSNSSNTTNTSNNTYTDNRWSGNTRVTTTTNNNNQAWNNGNTVNSGNTVTANSGNTSSTTTTTNNTVNNNQAWNNGNTTTTNSGNTTTTTTVTDNSNNSTNTNTNVQDNGNTNVNALLIAAGIILP